jgi:hypothetical protein
MVCAFQPWLASNRWGQELNAVRVLRHNRLQRNLFIESYGLQLIHDPRAGLHHAVPVPGL